MFSRYDATCLWRTDRHLYTIIRPVKKPFPKWKWTCSFDVVPSSYWIWHGQHGGCPAGSRDCLLFRSTWVYPRFFGGVHVAHMFLVLSVVCIVLVLSSLFSGVRQLFSIFHSFDYPFGISWLNIKYGSKNLDTFIWKILLNNWIWYQALIKDIQKVSNKNQILGEKKILKSKYMYYYFLIFNLVTNEKKLEFSVFVVTFTLQISKYY